MKRAALTAAVCLCCAVSAAAAAQLKRVTPSVVLAAATSNFPDYGQVEWLKDSKNILVVQYDRAGKPWISRYNVVAHRSQGLIKGIKPVPAPDGEHIAFLGLIGKQGAYYANSQLWICNSDGTGPHQLTNQTGGLGNGENVQFAWSPDSKQIAYSFMPKYSELQAFVEHGATSAGDQVTVQAYTGGIPPDLSSLGPVVVRVLSLENPWRAKEIVLPGHHPYNYALTWIDNGSRLVTNTTALEPPRHPGDWIFYDSRLDGIDVSSGRLRFLLGSRYTDEEIRLAAAASGKWLPLFTPSLFERRDLPETGFPGWLNDHESIALFDPAAPGRKLAVLQQPSGKRSCFAWDTRGHGFYFCDASGSTIVTRLVHYDDVTHRIRPVLSFPGWFRSQPAVSPDARSIAWIGLDLSGKVAVHVYSLAFGAVTTVTLYDPGFGMRVSPATRFMWRSRDGFPMDGILVKPVDFQSGKRYPLIVDVHGGPADGLDPTGSVLSETPLEWQMWANRGYAVLAPDYRTNNGGLAQALLRKKHNDWFERDFDDMMSGVDALIAARVVDGSRMAVIGHSYGSIETNWLITHTRRFKAAVSYEGAANESLFWSSTRGGLAVNEWMFGGTPMANPDAYRKESATTYAAYTRTPTLFVNNENGVNSESLIWMFSALRHNHVPTEFLYYAQEQHVLFRHANKTDLLKRVLNWVDQNLNR